MEKEVESTMTKTIDMEALFSDESSMFRVPEEPDAGDLLTIYFRTRKNDADEVELHVQYGCKEEAVCPEPSKPERETIGMGPVADWEEADEAACFIRMEKSAVHPMMEEGRAV